jgi:hypothetical protein
MKNKKFKLSHLFLGITALLIIEGILIRFLPMAILDEWLVIVFVIIGVGMNIYVAIEAIEEVSGHLRLLLFLLLIVLEFIVFFAFEYWYLLLLQPASFPTLTPGFINLLLHSTMIFVFNPIYLPATTVGRALLLANTLSALALVLFILQNVWQIHPKMPEASSPKL